MTNRPANWPNSARSLLDGLSACAASGRLNDALDEFNARELARLLNDWEFVARRDQWPPDMTEAGAPWRQWLILGGRGAGKTRAGAEWVKGLALGREQFCAKPPGRIALVGETMADVRDVMVDGVSGVLAVHARQNRPRWETTRRRLVWESGAVAQAFSAEDPESLRGPQFDAAWCDELAKWRYARETWDVLQFGLRLGDWTRVGRASFLTLDEQREALGYGPAPKDAVFLKRGGGSLERRYSPDQPRAPAGSPDGGQWTSGGGGFSGGSHDDRARREPDTDAPIRTALNINPNAASDVDASITLAQNRRIGASVSGATPSQLDRLESSARLANEAEIRVREIDPLWKPEPTLSDPNNIESRIARFESLTRQADERYSEFLREKYSDAIFPSRRDATPRGSLTGPRAPVRTQDDAETRRGAERENQSADILWLNGHNVEQKPDVPGPKRPDYRIDGEVFDSYAPRSGNAINIWANLAAKVNKRQAPSIVLNLSDSTLNVSELDSLLRVDPILGLNRLWVTDRNGKLVYVLGGP